MSDPAVLNAILRTYYSNSNYNTLAPPAIPPVEIDHFFEVQHIVALLQQNPPLIDPNSWYNVPIGQFVDLATFRMYLTHQVKNRQGALVTVESLVQEMVREMRGRNTPFSQLTRGVGTRLCTLMGW